MNYQTDYPHHERRAVFREYILVSQPHQVPTSSV